jgi:hypothetical protein
MGDRAFLDASVCVGVVSGFVHASVDLDSTFWELEHVFVLFLELEVLGEGLLGHVGGSEQSGDLASVCVITPYFFVVCNWTGATNDAIIKSSYRWSWHISGVGALVPGSDQSGDLLSVEVLFDIERAVGVLKYHST